VFVPLLLVTFFLVRAWQLPAVEAAARPRVRGEPVTAA
jgi:hypothetical protein